MKKSFLGITALLVVIATATYFYFSGKEYEVRISESQIQEKLSEKLPLTKSYLILFQVTLDNPRIELINGQKRINGGLDITLNMKIRGENKDLGGSLDLSGGIQYLRKDGAFYLTDPIIEKLSLDGIPEKHEPTAKKVLTQALAEFYNEHPIYTLNKLSAKEAAAKMILKDVTIENKEIVITMGI